MKAGDDDVHNGVRTTLTRRPMGVLVRLLREPLVQFLVAGIVLFSVYGVLHPERFRQDDTRRIVVTADDIKRIEMAWIAQWQRPPQPSEMSKLIESELREEILYREALLIGLDKGDIIVKRRLAQKMEFLAEDVAALRDPASAELRDWYAANKSQFALPPRATFRHIYFSFDRRQARAEEDARRALIQVRTVSAADSGPGDAFPYQSHYADRTPEQLAAIFGKQFAEALYKIDPGSWQGPVESGYGWHLVLIDSIVPGRVPAFEEIEPDVKMAWRAGLRAEIKRKTFEAMRARYVVELPALQ